MSELPDTKIDEARAFDPLLLEYDYYKHLSTIALVAIGAMFTWVQGGDLQRDNGWVVAVALITISAALCFGAMNTLIDHRKTGKKLRWIFRWERQIATAVFAVGLGIFMSEVGRTVG